MLSLTNQQSVLTPCSVVGFDFGLTTPSSKLGYCYLDGGNFNSLLLGRLKSLLLSLKKSFVVEWKIIGAENL